MNDHNIKRVLGVGMATMAEHLREYKDPFEPEERELSLVPIQSRRIDLVRLGASGPQRQENETH